MPSGIIVICASGPSLCAEDIAFVYKLGIPIIAVNSSWMMVPECQFIFAADDAWWKQNYLCIRSPAQRWTCSETAAQNFGINYFENTFSGTFNSGLVAILFAISLGTRRIILLGYDCSLQDSVHWHGRHKGLNNPTPYCVKRWKFEFKKLTTEIRTDAEIINCSRKSSLECFPLGTLNDVLNKIIHYH